MANTITEVCDECEWYEVHDKAELRFGEDAMDTKTCDVCELRLCSNCRKGHPHFEDEYDPEEDNNE